MDNVDGCTINDNLHSISCKFFVFLAIQDIPGNQSNLQIEAFVICSSINNHFHSVAMVQGRGQVAQKSSREYIICHGESMGAKKDLSFGEPIIQGCVPFKLPEGKGGANVDMETDDVVVVVIVGMPVVGDTNAIHVLGELVTRSDITFHCDAAKGRHHVNWENVVVAVDVLEDLQEVMDKWLDGIIHNCIGRAMDINMEQCIIQGAHRFVQGEKTIHESCLGGQVKH